MPFTIVNHRLSASDECIIVASALLQSELQKAEKNNQCAASDDARNEWFRAFVCSPEFAVRIGQRYQSYVESTDASRTLSSTQTVTTWKGNITKLSIYSAVYFLEFLRKYKKLECLGQAQKLMEYAKATVNDNAAAKVSVRS